MLKPKRRWTQTRIIFFLKRYPYSWGHLRFRERLYVLFFVLAWVSLITTVFSLFGVNLVEVLDKAFLDAVMAFTGFVDGLKGR